MSTMTHPEVEVRPAGGDEYEVVVKHGESTSKHLVRVSERSRQIYGGDAPPERLVAESFRWVYEREPQAKLLSRFDLPVIADHHPDYSHEIYGRLH